MLRTNTRSVADSSTYFKITQRNFRKFKQLERESDHKIFRIRAQVNTAKRFTFTFLNIFMA